MAGNMSGTVNCVVPLILVLLSGCLCEVFNFSRFSAFTDGVQLRLNGQIIDLGAFTVDSTNRALLENLRQGRTLEDFMYVATKLAGFEKRIARATFGRIVTNLNLEDIFDDSDKDDDIILNPGDVDRTETQMRNNPRILNLRGSDSSQTGRVKRNVVASDESKWPLVIPYIITSDFNTNPAGRQAIRDAIQHWEQETCLRFSQRNSVTGPHLRFRDIGDSICRSSVGRRTNGQDIYIGRFCQSLGIIVHEIGHALGFWHEQNRPDRNNFVQIHPENIRDGKLHNFLQRTWSEAEVHATPYDYSSDFHYSLTAFLRAPHRVEPARTLSPSDRQMSSTVGSNLGLSFFDAKIANQRYCSHICSPDTGEFPLCDDIGYKDPNNCNRCKCPDGLTGRLCRSVEPGVGATCGTNDLDATTFTKTLTSPIGGFPGRSECTWNIKAAFSHRIWFYFTSTFSFPCRTPCQSYLEVKYKDMVQGGPRYCCSRPTGWFLSNNRQMLVLMRTRATTRRNSFSLSYRAIHCGGYSGGFTRNESPCLTNVPYSCPVSYPCPSGMCVRDNICYRERKICNRDFELIGNRCIYRFRPWSAWSSCSATCGGCGSRQRTRTCARQNCSSIGRETCNVNPCPTVITSSCRTTKKCGIWNWRRCTIYKTCYRSAPPCCSNRRVVNNECVFVK